MAEPSSVDKLIQKVSEAIKKNNPDYAVEILNSQVFKVSPDHAVGTKLYFDAIQVKWKGKKLPAAKWLATKGLQANKMAKRWDALIESCRKQFPEDPANYQVLELLAEALMNKTYIPAALEVLKRLTEMHKEGALGWFWLSKCLKSTGDIQGAVRGAELAVQLEKTNGEFTKWHKDITAAATMDKSGLVKAQSFTDVVKNKGEAQAEAIKSKHRTKEDLIAEIKAKGGIEGLKDRKAAQEIAELYEKMQDWGGVVKAYKRAYELDNGYVDALDKAGDATLKYYDALIKKAETEGDQAKVEETRTKRRQFKVQEFKRRVTAHPNDLAARFEFGEGLYDIGQFKEAASELQKATKDPKKAGQAVLMLARCFYEIGQYDMAIMSFDKTLAEGRKEEDIKEAKYWKAHSLLKQGKKDEAKKLFMEIMSEDVNFRDIQEILPKL